MKKRLVVALSLIMASSMLLFTGCGKDEGKKKSESVVSEKETKEKTTKKEKETSKSAESSKKETSKADESESTSDLGEMGGEQTTTVGQNEQSTTVGQNEQSTTASNWDSGSSGSGNGGSGYNGTSGEPELEALVNNVLSAIIKPSMTDFEKTMAIHNWIVDNIKYDYVNYDAGTIPLERYTALGALRDGMAVCGGYAMAFNELASAAGINVVYVSGTANGAHGWGPHAWNQVNINGSWYNVDTTWDDIENEYGRYDYCLVSDDVLFVDHKTDSSAHNSCPTSYDRYSVYDYRIKAEGLANTYVAKNVDDTLSQVKKHPMNAAGTITIWLMKNDVPAGKTLEQIFEENRLPLSTNSLFENGDGTVRVECTVHPNRVYFSSISELTTVIDTYQDAIGQKELVYLTTVADGQYTLPEQFADLLYQTERTVELNSINRTKSYCVDFSVTKRNDVVIVKSATDMKNVISKYGATGICDKTIWLYKGSDTRSADLIIAEFFASAGYRYEGRFNSGGYDSQSGKYVIVVELTSLTPVTMVISGADIKSYIESGKDFGSANFYITTGCSDSDAQYNYVDKLMSESEYYFSYTLFCGDGYAIISECNKQSGIEVASNIDGLRADINKHIPKGEGIQDYYFLIHKSGLATGITKDQLSAQLGTSMPVWDMYESGNFYWITMWPW